MKIIGPDRTVDNCIIAQGIQVEGVFTRKICAFNRKFRGFWCIATSTWLKYAPEKASYCSPCCSPFDLERNHLQHFSRKNASEMPSFENNQRGNIDVCSTAKARIEFESKYLCNKPIIISIYEWQIGQTSLLLWLIVEMNIMMPLRTAGTVKQCTCTLHTLFWRKCFIRM